MLLSGKGNHYLYLDEIKRLRWQYWVTAAAVAIAVYLSVGRTTVTSLLVVMSFMCCSLHIERCNPVIAFLSGISMEIYLVHMMCFRIAEKLGLNCLLGSGPLQYAFTVAVVLARSIAVALIIRKGIRLLGTGISVFKIRRQRSADREGGPDAAAGPDCFAVSERRRADHER